MKSKINLTPIGTVIGILVPLLAILLTYFVKYSSEMTVQQFVDSLFVHKIYSKVLALGVYFGNIIFFFLFIKLDWLKAARGVLLATILYSFAMLIFKYGM